jgi:nuclear transport factor 2 (NTF2) superfamily protein
MYGTARWTVNDAGLSAARKASINPTGITEEQRRFHCPHGPRPQDYPGLRCDGLR